MTTPRRRSPLRAAAVGLTTLVVVDLTVGAIMTATGVLPPIDRGDVYRLERAQNGEDPPLSVASDPWFRQHLDDLVSYQSDQFEYAPFLQHAPYKVSSATINSTGAERVTYQPDAVATAAPTKVAFFGGSVVFGIGQRDEHTMPSAFARLAERDGHVVEAHNFGFPRWVAWQELFAFERALARGETFDLVIFLDGYNEFFVQTESFAVDPTFHAAQATGALIDDYRSDRSVEPVLGDGLSELIDSYRRNSAVSRVGDQVLGRTAPIPGYPPDVVGTPEEQTDAALDIYGRATQLIASLAELHEIPIVFIWQPQQAGWPKTVIERLPPQVTSLADVFDGREDDLYLDPVHTNEEGANLLAGAIWEEVRDGLVGSASEDGSSAASTP